MGEHPDIVGYLADEDGELQLPMYNLDNFLFKSLDGYLKKEKVRLADLFTECDYDGDGRLEGQELHTFFSTFMEVSESQMRYFAAMMDTDGDGSVSYKELVQVTRWKEEGRWLVKDVCVLVCVYVCLCGHSLLLPCLGITAVPSFPLCYRS